MVKRLLAYIAIAIIIAFIMFPFIWIILTSLKFPVEIFSYPPTFIPKNPTLHAYKTILSKPDPEKVTEMPIMTNLLNSCVVAISTMFASVTIGSCAAYGFARHKTKLAITIFVAILLMRTISRITIAIPLYLMMRDVGLLNTKLAVIITHITVTFPIVMFLMYSFFQDVPVELEEAARVDGCSRLGTFLRIILPLSAPGLAVASILAFLLSYNEFLFALVLLSNAETWTLPVALGSFIQQYKIAWDFLSAAGTIAIIPAVAAAFYLQKYIIKGLALGAVKG